MSHLLECAGIEKRYFGVPVLRGIDLTLGPGRVLGLAGENGAGKSTLMNILGGVVRPDAGTMRLGGEVFAPQNPAESTRRGVAFVHQELNLFSNLSIAENLFLPRLPARKVMDARATELLRAVNLPLDPRTLVENLSPGERQLVEIAKALGREARLMILDEPTTSLTSRETERLFALIGRLRSQGMALIYISHVLTDLFQLCDDLLVLRDGEVVGKGERDSFTTESLIQLMVGRSLSQIYPSREFAPRDEVILAVESLSQAGGLTDVSFGLRRGEVLGVAGLMGAGRTELARALFGLDGCDRGSIRLNGTELSRLSTRQRIGLGLAFLTENRREEGLLMEASVGDNIVLGALEKFATRGLIAVEAVHQAVNQSIDRLQIRATSRGEQPVRTLSGGNQQKVVLAKWLLREPAVFLLDEPTRGVDVGARAEIYRIIDQMTAAGAGVLFISSEIEELIGMCDRIMVMRQGRILTTLARLAFNREVILAAALGEGGEGVVK
jgi:ribose transport system ATP-binding protein